PCSNFTPNFRPTPPQFSKIVPTSPAPQPPNQCSTAGWLCAPPPPTLATPLRSLRGHVDAREALQPVRPCRKYRRPSREPQLPCGCVLPFPLAVALQLRNRQPLARSRHPRRDLEPLFEALWRTIPTLLRELDRPHEAAPLPTEFPLNLQLASTHLVHQLPIQCAIVELGKDRRPHQRQRDLLGHLALFVKEPIGPLERPRLAKSPADGREPRPQSCPLHEPSGDRIRERIDEVAERLVVGRSSRVAGRVTAPEAVVSMQQIVAAPGDQAVQQLLESHEVAVRIADVGVVVVRHPHAGVDRSEEHTSELQSCE